jgi:hypothetical protein
MSELQGIPSASQVRAPKRNPLLVTSGIVSAMNAISNPAPDRGIAITDNLPATTVEGVS